MSAERIFKRPKRKKSDDPVDKLCDTVFDRWRRREWLDLYARTGNITPDEWAASVFKPFLAALNDLTGGRFRRILFEGIMMKSAEPFWAWDRIRLMAKDKIDHGDTSHDWAGLIEAIDSYHAESDTSPKREIENP